MRCASHFVVGNRSLATFRARDLGGLLWLLPKHRLPVIDNYATQLVITPLFHSVISMERRNVLIVEDEDDARSLYAFMLAKTGYRVRAVKNGLEALTEIQIERPDVILTDIAMPIITGIELIKVVKASKELSDLPIVAMTSYSAEFQELARQAGANEIIDKSIEEERLCHIISSFIVDPPKLRRSQ